MIGRWIPFPNEVKATRQPKRAFGKLRFLTARGKAKGEHCHEENLQNLRGRDAANRRSGERLLDLARQADGKGARGDRRTLRDRPGRPARRAGRRRTFPHRTGRQLHTHPRRHPRRGNEQRQGYLHHGAAGIILAKDAIITVCLEETPVLYALKQRHANNLRTHMQTRFILQILYRNASLYLQYLRVINRLSDKIEQKLHGSTENRELIELLELEKSLVYFTTSLRSNEVVLEKLLKSERIKKYPEDQDLLEDVIVENRQAIEMANIYSGILSGMMDAFASVISNNLNIVMKFLAVMTIVLSVPAIIFAAYGMNVNAAGMPLAKSPFGFLAIVLVSLAVSVGVAIYLAKKKMF